MISTVFLVLALIFVVLIAIIVAAATANRQRNYQMGPGYIEEPVYVDDTPLVAGMIAADVASDIAFAATAPMVGMDQGQYYDNSGQDMGNQDMGGGNFLGGDQGFSDSSSGFDLGGDS